VINQLSLSSSSLCGWSALDEPVPKCADNSIPKLVEQEIRLGVSSPLKRAVDTAMQVPTRTGFEVFSWTASHERQRCRLADFSENLDLFDPATQKASRCRFHWASGL